MDIEFGKVEVPVAGTEMPLLDNITPGNNPGPKSILVYNWGDGIAIVRYYYARENGDYLIMKSLDADIENEIPASPDGGVTPGEKHIVMEGSYMVEFIKITAVIKPAEIDVAILEGCYIMPHGVGSREM